MSKIPPWPVIVILAIVAVIWFLATEGIGKGTKAPRHPGIKQGTASGLVP